MALPVVVVSEFGVPSDDTMLLKATPANGIENRNHPRRFYNFNMVITQPFSFQNTNQLTLSDNNSVDVYHLVDRLGNPVLAEQLEMYASNRRCVTCQFDSVTNIIRVLGCICPTDYYIKQWLTPTTPSTASTSTVSE